MKKPELATKRLLSVTPSRGPSAGERPLSELRASGLGPYSAVYSWNILLLLTLSQVIAYIDRVNVSVVALCAASAPRFYRGRSAAVWSVSARRR
ncbi:MAG: hypothetical protein JO001_04070 [Alphaproteobacteria bacterium]|nr:hypothetical protein [Alphaproteobacteria bacterium]